MEKKIEMDLEKKSAGLYQKIVDNYARGKLAAFFVHRKNKKKTELISVEYMTKMALFKGRDPSE